MTEAFQSLFTYAIFGIVAVVPTVLIFAAARRTIRPRNFLPTGKLTVTALALSWGFAWLMGVEFSGGIVARVVYVAIVAPLVALVIVAFWWVFNKLIAGKGSKPVTSSSAK